MAAVAVLPDGRIVTGGVDDRVRLRNMQGHSPDTVLACSASARGSGGSAIGNGHEVEIDLGASS